MKTTIIRNRSWVLLPTLICLFFTSACNKSGDSGSSNNNTSAQWTLSNGTNGISPSSNISCLAVSGTTLFAGASFGIAQSGVFISTDKGNTWTAIDNGLTNTSYVNALLVVGTKIYAAADDGVYVSNNNGASWTAVNNGIPSYYNIESLAVSGNNIFVGTTYSNGVAGTVYLSTNNGASWTKVSSGLSSSILADLRSLAVMGSNIFATDGSFIYRSTNNGTSWTNINSGISSYINCLAVVGNNIFAGTLGSGVFVSTNNGASWTAANTGFVNRYTGLPEVENVTALYTNGSNLYAGTEGDGVFLSTNNGTTWTQVDKNSATIPSEIASLAIIGNTVFAGNLCGYNSGGVWKLN